MRFSAPVLPVSLALLLLASTGCNYVEPMMYIDIGNHSGHPIGDVEVKYPAGTFGLYVLQVEQTRRRLVPVGTPCKFRIDFEDQTGKTHAKDFDLGARCPREVAFEVGDGMNISQRVVHP